MQIFCYFILTLIDIRENCDHFKTNYLLVMIKVISHIPINLRLNQNKEEEKKKSIKTS